MAHGRQEVALGPVRELGRLLRRHERIFSLQPLFRFVGQGHQIPDGRGELHFFSRPLARHTDPLMADHAGQSTAEENGHVQQRSDSESPEIGLHQFARARISGNIMCIDHLLLEQFGEVARVLDHIQSLPP